MTSISDILQTPVAEQNAALLRASQSIHCAMPGIIKSFDISTQTASITPAVRRVSGNRATPYPDLVDVPVFFPGGSESGLLYRVNPGDECLVIFSDVAIDNWYYEGGIQNPSSCREHSLSDAFAFVGFRSRKNALPAGSVIDGVGIITLDEVTAIAEEVFGDDE